MALNSIDTVQGMIYIHKTTGKKVAIPRHSEIKNKFIKNVLKEITKKED